MNELERVMKDLVLIVLRRVVSTEVLVEIEVCVKRLILPVYIDFSNLTI